MDASKFDSFMNEVMAYKNTAKKPSPTSLDFELGNRKEEIIALYTEQHIARRIIFDNLVKSGIIKEDRSF